MGGCRLIGLYRKSFLLRTGDSSYPRNRMIELKIIGWIVKSQCQRGLKIELESQPQNMINLNEVVKDVCLAPDFVRQPSVFSVSRSLNS